MNGLGLGKNSSVSGHEPLGPLVELELRVCLVGAGLVGFLKIGAQKGRAEPLLIVLGVILKALFF